ncbi:VOC family protein [Bacillus sp. JCM 19034]|uniref:VOC family protein n=1 Tax=Bacillus sp. JCM 19034 TaxID=1481928 RepID=UPI0018CFFC06|nr:VOC family protein [Bacillus sp. JCM 19034]
MNSFYPVILTNSIEETSLFYQTHFDFKPIFEADWYVSLQKGTFELALLNHSHPTIPEGFRAITEGLILNFEVDDVDKLYEDLILKQKLPLHLDIRDESFGQRHFITSDPNGTLLDIIKVIPPDETYNKHYNENIWDEK